MLNCHPTGPHQETLAKALTALYAHGITARSKDPGKVGDCV